MYIQKTSTPHNYWPYWPSIGIISISYILYLLFFYQTIVLILDMITSRKTVITEHVIQKLAC